MLSTTQRHKPQPVLPVLYPLQKLNSDPALSNIPLQDSQFNNHSINYPNEFDPSIGCIPNLEPTLEYDKLQSNNFGKQILNFKSNAWENIKESSSINNNISNSEISLSSKKMSNTHDLVNIP